MAKPIPRVNLRVPEPLLRQLFRLDDSMRITGAEFDPSGFLVTLTVEAPDAPKGAVEIAPVYHHNGRPDPVSLTEVRWLMHDGTERVQPVEPAAK